MADLREAILARLTVIISENIAGIESATRNLDQTPDSKMPAIVLYDGDETASDITKPGRAPTIVTMEPVIALALGDVPENVGTVTNEWRAKIVKAVLQDGDLEAMTSGVPNGGARYMGCTTSLNQGRTSQVELVTNFAIVYPMHPSRL